MPPQRQLPAHSRRGDLESSPLSGGSTVLMSDCLGRYLHVKPTHHEWSTSARIYHPNHWYNRTATPEPIIPEKSAQLLLYQQKQKTADEQQQKQITIYHNTTNNGYGHHTRQQKKDDTNNNKDNHDDINKPMRNEAKYAMQEGRNYEYTRKRLGLNRYTDDIDISTSTNQQQQPQPHHGSQTQRINYNSTQLRRFGTTPTNTEWYSSYSQGYALNTLNKDDHIQQQQQQQQQQWNGEYDPHRSAASGLGFGRRHRYHRTYLASV